MDKLINYFISCGYSPTDAIKEIEKLIHYHTSGLDPVSREFAIELLLADIETL